MKTSEIITISDLCSQGIALLCGCVLHVSGSYHLSLANRVHDFYARNRTARRPKRLKPKHRARESFHCAVAVSYTHLTLPTILRV